MWFIWVLVAVACLSILTHLARTVDPEYLKPTRVGSAFEVLAQVAILIGILLILV